MRYILALLITISIATLTHSAILPPKPTFASVNSSFTATLNVTSTLNTDAALRQSLAAVSLNATNQLRALHGCSALTINSTLTNAAQAHAKVLGDKQAFYHSSDAINGKYGENLYMAGAYPNLIYRKGNEVFVWYSEISNYNFATGKAIDPTKPIGHFTAEVWKSVTSVGFGYYYYTKTANGKIWKYIIVVANYYPTPNVQGQYIQNVPVLI